MNQIKKEIVNIGKAMLQVGLQNTHSGNVSVRHRGEMYITRAGSMKGHLTNDDIVMPGLFKEMPCKPAPSTETGTHRGILKDWQVSVHAHSLHSILVSTQTDNLEPVDFLGKSILKEIPIISFQKPTNSPEMEQKIPSVLKNHPSMIVKTHGPFCRGNSLTEAFFNLCVTDFSAHVYWNLKSLNVDFDTLKDIEYPLGNFYDDESLDNEADWDSEIAQKIKITCNDIFSLKLSPFFTGSVSVREGKRTWFTKQASCPEYISNSINHLPVEASDNDDFIVQLHKQSHQSEGVKSVIFTYSPNCVIHSLFLFKEKSEFIEPLDAEGRFLYPEIPVIYDFSNIHEIIARAQEYKVVILAGIGALSISDSLNDDMHHISSLENICYLKNRYEMMKNLKISR